MNLNELYRTAFEKNGEAIQLFVAVEEMSELQKELSKFYRGCNNRAQIAEEISDVLMVVYEQMEHLALREQVAQIFKQKAERLARNLGVMLDYEPPADVKCRPHDKIAISVYGELAEVDPCIYKPVRGFKNVTITEDVCEVCGHREISWYKQDDTEELDVGEGV